MLQLALNHPGLRMTFNMVPVLLEQLQAYAQGQATDYHLELSKKPAGSLTEDERQFVVRDFFMAHWSNMVEPYQRYRELLDRRGRHFHPAQLPQASRKFSEQDLLDLQVWFNLSWIDPIHFNQDPELAALKSKMRDYTEEEKLRVLSKQLDIIKKIIPAYRQAWEEVNIEVSTSPYYHPILPLLCDSDSAREGLPHSPLPKRFSYPQDAAAQLTSGQHKVMELLGRKADGLWPSEGSVSSETVQLAASSGFRWMATDEAILEKSLGLALREQGGGSMLKAYRPYLLEGTGGPCIFFRDRILSDLIGFTYHTWEPQAAAQDFINRLEGTADKLGNEAGKHIVPVILDGENAWESYANDGHDFLNALYAGLSKSAKINCCTFSEYLDQGYDNGRLGRIFPGSWINGDFSIWIGQEEDNRAWNELMGAREEVARMAPELDQATKDLVYRELYIAEGSDWCWWYGGNFSSENLEDFDLLFRGHLQRIYELLARDVPASLLSPISRGRPAERLVSQPLNLIHPVLDGRISDFYEWSGCGSYDIKQDGGTMHRSQSLLEAVHFGFDLQNLYLRLDPHPKYDNEELAGLSVAVEPVHPPGVKLTLPIRGPAPQGCELAFARTIEVRLPFKVFGLETGQQFSFYVSLCDNGTTIERHPINAPITVIIPNPDFDAGHWGA
jgi:alpha-amylase/alpha-mannosidase (GH57 family)